MSQTTIGSLFAKDVSRPIEGVIKADDAELAANPRSAPVRLRAATRIRPAAEAPAPEPAPRPRTHPARKPAQGRRGR